MQKHIAQVTLLVKDYDEAIEFYVDCLGFTLLENFLVEEPTQSGHEKRWVVVAPDDSQTRLLLTKADNAEQLSRVGNQTGGRVGFFLYTDNFRDVHSAFVKAGVCFTPEQPRVEPYGTVAVFEDLYGNLWDLIEPS